MARNSCVIATAVDMRLSCGCLAVHAILTESACVSEPTTCRWSFMAFVLDWECSLHSLLCRMHHGVQIFLVCALNFSEKVESRQQLSLQVMLVQAVHGHSSSPAVCWTFVCTSKQPTSVLTAHCDDASSCLGQSPVREMGTHSLDNQFYVLVDAC